MRTCAACCTAARWIADGNTSLDDCEALTWSLGWTGAPTRSEARLASTPLAFMFELVPEPVWKTSTGKCSSHLPSATSTAAAEMASAIWGSSTPSSALTRAPAPLMRASAAISARSIGWPETGKFSTARCVCAAHLAWAGTRTSPMVSCSTRYPSSCVPLTLQDGICMGGKRLPNVTGPARSAYGHRFVNGPSDTETYTELLPLGPDETTYRLVTRDGIGAFEAGGHRFLTVEREVLTALTRQAMHDIAHYLRAGHLAQLRAILDDPEASANDRFVALDLLKNACISAGGVLPMCQDTGTAIVKGKKGQFVFTGGGDEEAIARGVRETYERDNLRYSQMAPLTMWDEVNTKTTPPAEIKIAAVDGDAYKLLYMAKGGGSANKSFLFQETKAVLNPTGLMRFLDEKLRLLGTAACPPYHLAVVVGGTSAEMALETAKLASARYLDALPTAGSAAGHGFRDVELEGEVLRLVQGFGIGAQFGGKYFCHDVRVIRLPRHGASCPVAIAVSCSADRQALAKITRDGVYLEALERDPAKYLPETTDEHLSDDKVVRIDLNRPMDEIRAELTRHPVK